MVRFHQGAPILSRVRLAAIPPGLGPGFRKFESFTRDQFFKRSSAMKRVIEIRAAEGGEDSKLFVKDLAQAYMRLALKLG